MANGTFPYNAFTDAERELIARSLRWYADAILAGDPEQAECIRLAQAFESDTSSPTEA